MKGLHCVLSGYSALSAAVVLHSSTVIATSSTSSLGCVTSSAGDGFCDRTNNNEDCGFDGGDCCPCDCLGIPNEYCAFLQSQCVDPSASCVGGDNDFTFVPNDDFDLGCAISAIGDGDCDRTNNNEECGYDGGDCCQCTCVSTVVFTCGENRGFQCVDPSASCVDDDDVTTIPSDDWITYDDDFSTSLGCIPTYFGDGDCDRSNNDEDCGYDGGDCCQCTCTSTPDYDCGVNGFQCIDPSAPCVDDDDVTFVPSDDFSGDDGAFDDDVTFDYNDSYTSLGCIPGFIADGDCDTSNDNEACGYDGGDCCQCTCVSTDAFTCGENGFLCLDPSAPCVDDDDFTAIPTSDDDFNDDDFNDDSVTSLGCILPVIGDTFCDTENNNEDCARCPCSSGWIWADVSYGGPSGFDGGDCCPCNCDNLPAYICTYYQTFLCVDPSPSCEEDDDFSDSQCVGDFLGDGKCDQDNNNEDCDYDGGDCCECTCISTPSHTCGDNDGFDCVDPSDFCMDGFVEAGTKTAIGVNASAYDERPGKDSNDIGCGQDGCAPLLVRDRVISNIESRWSCASKIVPDGDVCEIDFTFETPQGIEKLQAAFWKRAERERTLKVKVNGDEIGEFDSDSESDFTSFAIETNEVKTLTLESIGIGPTEWISLLEVRFIVEP